MNKINEKKKQKKIFLSIFKKKRKKKRRLINEQMFDQHLRDFDNEERRKSGLSISAGGKKSGFMI